jgi:hypothetical protein
MGRTSGSRWRARGTRLIAALGLGAFCALGASCAGVEDLSGTDGTGTGGTGGTGGVIGTGPGGTTGSTALLGTWTRAILLAGDNGDIHESRTTWEFRQDGSAVRTVLAWNLSQGLYDTIVSVAQWRTNGSQLTLTYIAGSTGTASFSFGVNGDILTIGPDQFARLR